MLQIFMMMWNLCTQGGSIGDILFLLKYELYFQNKVNRAILIGGYTMVDPGLKRLKCTTSS